MQKPSVDGDASVLVGPAGLERLRRLRAIIDKVPTDVPTAPPRARV